MSEAEEGPTRPQRYRLVADLWRRYHHALQAYLDYLDRYADYLCHKADVEERIGRPVEWVR